MHEGQGRNLALTVLYAPRGAGAVPGCATGWTRPPSKVWKPSSAMHLRCASERIGKALKDFYMKAKAGSGLDLTVLYVPHSLDSSVMPRRAGAAPRRAPGWMRPPSKASRHSSAMPRRYKSQTLFKMFPRPREEGPLPSEEGTFSKI